MRRILLHFNFEQRENGTTYINVRVAKQGRTKDTTIMYLGHIIESSGGEREVTFLNNTAVNPRYITGPIVMNDGTIKGTRHELCDDEIDVINRVNAMLRGGYVIEGLS